MSVDQKRARWFGVLYLITFATSIPALWLYEPALRDPAGYITGGGGDKRVLFGALLELLLIVSNIGTAIVIVPIMRRKFEELSIGYVAARIFESTFILVGIVAMVGIVTLHREAAGSDSGTVAFSLAALKDWTFLLGPGWVVGVGNGMILGYMMYKSGLVPRAWTWLGMVGGPLLVLAGTITMFHGNPAWNAIKGPATLPEAIWELFLGIYCLAWGFKSDAPILTGEQADEVSAAPAVVPA